MSNAELTSLLQALSVLAVLLLIGTFLRAKVKFFQKLLLPASVIGGFIGLLVGPILWGPEAIIKTSFTPVPFSANWLSTWANLPGVLIVPIFAAVPLGMFMGKKAKGGVKLGAPKILMTLGLFAAAGCLQNILGFGTNLVYSNLVPGSGLYPTFGYELAQGYTGGHGTAAGVGPLLQSFGLDYWPTAQGVAITFATVGLVGGMLLGIVFINIAQRKGKTALLNKGGSIPEIISRGINKNVEKQASLGRETTTSSSIETISLHAALLLVACLGAYGIKALLAMGVAAGGTLGTILSGINAIPVWFWALITMYGVNALLIVFKLNWIVDTKVKSRITGTLTDFAVTAAIASLDIMAVAAYIVPIVILCVLGFIATYIIIFPMTKFCFGDDHPFERSIMSWGVNTGVMITGMMLLKICDPDYETPALSDFSLGFSSASLFTIFLSPINYGLLRAENTTGLLIFNFGQFALFMAVALIGTALFRKVRKGMAARGED